MLLSREYFIVLRTVSLATILALSALATDTATGKGPPPLITICGAIRCVDFQERSIQRAPLTVALLSGGRSGAKADCQAETHRVRVRWRAHGESTSRSYLIVASRGLRGPGRMRGSGLDQSWVQVHGARRKALKRAARRAGPGTSLCQLTARRTLFQGSLSGPWLYPR